MLRVDRYSLVSTVVHDHQALDDLNRTGAVQDEAVARLKRELSRVTKERDCLKDAAAYFAKQSPNGTRWLSAVAAIIP